MFHGCEKSLWATNPGWPFLAWGGEEKRAFGWPRKKDSLHRTLLKAPKNLHAGELLIPPFLSSQARLALGGEILRPGDARGGWQELARDGANTAGRFHSPPTAYLHLPASSPKSAPPFSSF